MDLETIRSGLQQAVPFNNHLGLELLAVEDGAGTVRLPEAGYLLNHVGSQHAGALFGVGEAASGAAVIGAFADQLGNVTPLVRGAEIRYSKIARGPITAVAKLAEPGATVLERLSAASRTDLDVQVEMSDATGLKVAEMTVRWVVRKNA